MISVIVPVHNSELTLDRCVQSIVNQTYKDIEIILVENGSKDSSLEKCLKWQEKDKRIRVISLSDARISIARNAGLSVIKGDFFAFVDSDDYIDTDMYKKMSDSISGPEIDIVNCRVNNVYPDGHIGISPENGLKEFCDKKNIIFWFKEGEQYVRRVIWRSIYRSSRLKNIRFDETMSFKEDGKYLAECIKKANKISFLDEALYYYTEFYYQPNFYLKKYYSSNFINTLKEYSLIYDEFGQELDPDVIKMFKFDVYCSVISGIILNENKYRDIIMELLTDNYWKRINTREYYKAYLKYKNKTASIIKGVLIWHKQYLLLQIVRRINEIRK